MSILRIYCIDYIDHKINYDIPYTKIATSGAQCMILYTNNITCQNIKLNDLIGGNNSYRFKPYISELTVHYWVWKNFETSLVGNPDYVGFCPYRRFMLKPLMQYPSCIHLNADHISDNVWNDFNDILPYISDETTQLAILKDYDIIMPPPYNWPNHKNYSDQYSALKAWICPVIITENFYDVIIDIIKNVFIEYGYTSIDEILKTPIHYHYNMFTMSKKYFFEYSEIFWASIERIYSAISSLSPQEIMHLNHPTSSVTYRWLGYISELLTTLLIHSISQKYNLKIYNTNLVAFKDKNI